MTKMHVRKYWKPALIVLFLLLWEGLPLAILGLDRFLGRQIAALLILMLLVISVYDRASKGRGINQWELIAVFLLLVIFGVSFISNTFLFPLAVGEWLPSLYLFFPLIILIPFSSLRVGWRDVVAGFIVAGFLGSALILFDSLYRLSFLDTYERLSSVGFIDRRIVLLKTEASIAALVVSIRIFMRRDVRSRFINGLVLSVLLYGLVFVSESRLAIAAVIIGAALFSIFVLAGKARLKYISIGLAFSVIVAPLVLEKYINQIYEGGISENDSSVVFRIIEMEYFKEHFEETNGIGFGSMSVAKESNNFLSDSLHSVGYYYGSGGYGMRVNDLGILGALYQFGYIGFFLVLYMTLRASFSLMLAGRSSKNYLDAGCVGAIMLAFMMSPVPMNFFTLDFSVIHGGLLWHLCAACYEERAKGTGLSDKVLIT